MHVFQYITFFPATFSFIPVFSFTEDSAKPPATLNDSSVPAGRDKGPPGGWKPLV